MVYASQILNFIIKINLILKNDFCCNIFDTFKKETVVVPEEWVQELSNAKLKNNGKNSYQDFLVFWSATDGKPNYLLLPNFNAPLNYEYHADVDEVCYIGRVKRFFGK